MQQICGSEALDHTSDRKWLLVPKGIAYTADPENIGTLPADQVLFDRVVELIIVTDESAVVPDML